MWCLYRFYQRNKSRCRCKRDVTIEYLTRATFEKQLTALHVVRIIIFLSGMCLFCWQKCGPRPKLFLRLDIFSTFRGVHALIFIYVLYIVIGLHEEPANFNREKRSVAFVTNRFFTFLEVLSLICLVTKQILICENQIIWRLEILLRAIVAALLKTKCNGRFVKNKRYQETARNISQ